jgi:hypothetical protein
LNAEVNGYTCRKAVEDEYIDIFNLLAPIVAIDTSLSIQKSKQKKLKSLIKNYESLVCLKGKELIGVAVYRHFMLGIELFHLYIKPEYRVTYGSGLLNHYVINVEGKDKEVILTTQDISTFEKVVDIYREGSYKITDRARNGLSKMLKGKITWEEQ